MSVSSVFIFAWYRELVEGKAYKSGLDFRVRKLRGGRRCGVGGEDEIGLGVEGGDGEGEDAADDHGFEVFCGLRWGGEGRESEFCWWNEFFCGLRGLICCLRGLFCCLRGLFCCLRG